jgi:hypothetical protein
MVGSGQCEKCGKNAITCGCEGNMETQTDLNDVNTVKDAIALLRIQHSALVLMAASNSKAEHRMDKIRDMLIKEGETIRRLKYLSKPKPWYIRLWRLICR